MYEKGKNTPLHGIINPDKIGILIKAKKIDINHQGERGNTPLHVAKFDYIVKALVENGADKDKKNFDGSSPLHTVEDFGAFKALEKLGLDINEPNSFGNTPAHYQTKNLKILKFLDEKGADFEAKNTNNKTPIFSAVEGKNIEAANFLISKNVKLDEKTRSTGDTPLHIAVENKDIKMIDLLIKNGAEMKEENRYKVTPYYLVEKEHERNPNKTNKKILNLFNDYLEGKKKRVKRLKSKSDEKQENVLIEVLKQKAKNNS